MEIHRQINVATRVVFPIIDADGDTVTAAAALDSESTTWADGSNPGAFADLTNEATEIGTSGIYYLILTAAEVNFDYIYIRIQTTTTGAKTQHILINTRFAPRSDASGRVDVGSVLGTAQTAGDIIGDTNDIQARLPAALVGGRMDASLGAIAAGVDLSATMKASVNTEVDSALDTAIPGTPTADSVNQRIRSMDLLTEAGGGGDLAAILTDTGTTLDGKLPAALVGGRIDASVGAMAANVVTAAAINTGAIDADAIALDAANEILGSTSGTADSGTTTTVVDTERTEADTDYWKGALILFTSGTLNGQCRLVTAFNAATDTITFAPATTVAVGTHTYRLLPAGRADVHFWLGDLVNALVSGRVDSSVGAMAASVLTAAALAADAVDEIWDEAMVEPSQAAPAAAPALRTILAYLYTALRNAITVTSSTKTFSNDAGTVTFKKALTDDGTTYTEAEAVAGP